MPVLFHWLYPIPQMMKFSYISQIQFVNIKKNLISVWQIMVKIKIVIIR
jgi:hypothetical protein